MQESSLPPSPETVEPVETQPRSGPSVLLWSVLVAVAFVGGLFTGYLLWEQPLAARAVAAEQKLAALQKTAEVSATTDANASATAEAGQVPQQVKRYNVTVDDDPVLGSEKAPITIIEFSDYQCPFCQRWQQEVLPQIEKNYGDKVRFVYRDFPLYEIHPEAEPAAIAADCAGEQKKYFAFHDLLFSGQKELGKDTYIAYAQALKLNMDAFQKCIGEQRYQNEVKADYDSARQIGVQSTPTFFINGLAVVGAQPYDVFKQVIDLELAGKIPK